MSNFDAKQITNRFFVDHETDKDTDLDNFSCSDYNDRFFNIEQNDRMIPYGIVIMFMEDEHFDRVFKPFDQTSPIIPSGSDKISYLLPALQISSKC